MTEQEVMQILTDMGLHEGGMDNWVPNNFWYFANVVEAAARADEREAIATWFDGEAGSGRIISCISAAKAIRARGTT